MSLSPPAWTHATIEVRVTHRKGKHGQGFSTEPVSAGTVEHRVRECQVRFSVPVESPTGVHPSRTREHGTRAMAVGNARVPGRRDGDGAAGELPQRTTGECGRSVSGACAAPPARGPRQRAHVPRVQPRPPSRSIPKRSDPTLSPSCTRVDDTRCTPSPHRSNNPARNCFGIRWGRRRTGGAADAQCPGGDACARTVLRSRLRASHAHPPPCQPSPPLACFPAYPFRSTALGVGGTHPTRDSRL
jgi:hypothetical protein